MEFDETKVFTALNAGKATVGSKGYFADDIGSLRDMVANKENLMIHTAA